MIENNPNLERVVDKSGLNGFHHAAAEGQVQVLEFLRGIKFDINVKTVANETPLLLAARNGQFESVDFLLKNGADPLITSKSLITAKIDFLPKVEIFFINLNFFILVKNQTFSKTNRN